MNVAEMRRDEWAVVADRFADRLTLAVVRSVTATQDLISPNARARHGYQRGERVTWSLHLILDGTTDLTAEYGDAHGVYLPGVWVETGRYDRKRDAEAAAVTTLADVRTGLRSVDALLDMVDGMTADPIAGLFQ